VPLRKVFIYTTEENIVEITLESIHKEFEFPTTEKYDPFSDETLTFTYKILRQPNKENMFGLIFPSRAPLP